MIADASGGLFQFLGRLHPALLHLPIGLWIAIAFLEFGGALMRRPNSRWAVVPLSWFAAIAAAVAAATGWVLALEPDYSGKHLELHRWLGVATACTGVLAALLAGFTARQPFRLVLLGVLGLLVAAGHVGGVLTHGQGFLSEPFDEQAHARPAAQSAAPGASATGASATDASATDAPAIGAPANGAPADGGAITFATDVRPLFEHYCSGCHNPEKHKGKLSLHDEAAIRKGGKDGPVIAPGKPDESPMLQRLLLPADDEDHMPPPEKAQPTAAEIAVLRRWIAAGAPFAAGTSPAPAGSGARGGTPAAPPSTDPAKGTPPGAGPPKDEPPPTGTPRDGTPRDAAARGRAAPIEPANQAAVAALRERLVHVQEPAPGQGGLWLDFAAIAPTLTEAEAKTLLVPVAPQVVELGLARAPVGDDLCALCATMPRLQKLDLRGTAVTGKGVAQLRALPQLQELVLAQTKLDDGAVEPLLAMPALHKLYVWNAGLSADAVARLRGKAGLTVDAGDAPPAKALESEGELQFVNELPPPGQPAAPPEVLAALRPVNDVCPVSGKPVDPRFVVLHGQRAIGFCCPNCPKEFWGEPGKFAVKQRER